MDGRKSLEKRTIEKKMKVNDAKDFQSSGRFESTLIFWKCQSVEIDKRD